MTPKKRKHRFVVGWKGEMECVYGKRISLSSVEPYVGMYTYPMTEIQASRQLKRFDEDAAIYELVPVDITKGKL